METNDVLRKLIYQKQLTKKECTELANMIDRSKDNKLIIAFQVLCTHVFDTNFSAMNAYSILEELKDNKQIVIK